MSVAASSSPVLVFADVARPAPKRRERPPVLSIRLTAEERDALEREAAGRSLSSYVRGRLFDRGNGGKRRRGRSPIDDHKALARVLGAMGRSPAIGTLQGVLRVCDEGAVLLGPEAESALLSACAAIEDMRFDLMRALGLKAE